jgi:hypothetical protein
MNPIITIALILIAIFLAGCIAALWFVIRDLRRDDREYEEMKRG